MVTIVVGELSAGGRGDDHPTPDLDGRSVDGGDHPAPDLGGPSVDGGDNFAPNLDCWRLHPAHRCGDDRRGRALCWGDDHPAPDLGGPSVDGGDPSGVPPALGCAAVPPVEYARFSTVYFSTYIR